MSAVASADYDADIRRIATSLAPLEGPLLPILHAIQAAHGHVDERALPIVADVLNLSRAEVHGVTSFYHDFRREPPGRHVVRLCRAEACQSMGSERIARHLEEALGVAFGSTSADGRVTLEPVYCLGNCALAPAATVDGELLGRVDEALVPKIVVAVGR